MAVITDAQIAVKKNMILMEIGEQDANSGPVAPNIDAIWDSESGKGGGDLELCYLYVKRKAIDITIGAIWRGDYIQVGIQNKSLDGKLGFLQAERKTVQDQLNSYIYVGTYTLDIYEPDETVG